VDDEELRELLKDNGIGRPSTRANIIETLFRRKYIERKKKNIIPTEKGIHLIDTISNELLKSPELTGEWEKKLRLIEKQQYDYEHFKDELKQMVMDLTNEILSPKAYRLEKAIRDMGKTPCPKCKQGFVIKGNSAYGCTRHTEGCTFRLPVVVEGAELTESQVQQLIVSKSVSFTVQDGEYRFEMTESFEVKTVVNQ